MNLRLDRTNIVLLAFVIATTALLSAWIIQWMGYEPCALCFQQRLPYHVGTPLLALASFMELVGTASRRTRNMLVVLALVSFTAGTALAANHVGVEQGYWPGPSACSARVLDTSSLEAFAAQIGTFQMVSCSTPSFTLLGFSLAWWNLFTSLLITGILAFSLLQPRLQK